MTPPKRNLVAALVVIVLLAVTLSACKEPGPAQGNRLLLVGDSIFAGSVEALEAALIPEGWDPFFQSQAGTTIEDWAAHIQPAIDASHPDVVVIELGTNDCGTVACVNLEPYIDRLMQKLAFADAVLWLTVQTDTIIPEKPDYVNSQIKAAAGRWSNLFIIDMATYFEGHTEWRDDGTHPNAEGQRQMANLIANSLQPFKPEAG